MNKKIKIVDDINESEYKDIAIDTFGTKIMEKMMSEKEVINKKNKIQNLIIPKNHNNKYGIGYKVNEFNETEIINGKIKKKSFYGTEIIITKGEYKGKIGKILDNKEYSNFNELLKENKYILIDIEVYNKKEFIKVEYIQIHIKKEEKFDDNKIIKADKKAADENNEKITWIKPDIIIRIIDENSKYYKTKAKVIDIIDDYHFSLLTKDSIIHNNFKEEDCETVIPEINEPVLVLYGEYINQKGRLIEKDKKNDKVLVQIDDDLSIIQLTQDDISAI